MTAPEPDDPRSRGSWFRRRFGRRGSCLLLLGGLWFLIGLGLVLIPMERFSRNGPGGPLQFMDTPPWPGLVWVVGGVIAVACGLLRARQRRDDWGFNGLILPVVVWALTYLGSWSTSLLTGGYYGRPNNWIGFLVYAAMALLLLLIANWPDPDDPHLPDRTGRSWGV